MELIRKSNLYVFFLYIFHSSYGYDSNIPINIVESWATKIGTELWNFGDVITRRKEMQESFKDAKVEPREGRKLVEDIAREIKNMMELKISAVRRIMDNAENMAMAASQSEGNVPLDYQYYSAKNLEGSGSEKLILRPNSHFFGIPVNTSYSAVHVPTNVYDKSPDVLHGIKWSEKLDDIFKDNYRTDPSLSWQYFGSSTGFMRQFPAMQWRQIPSEPVDLYDCRTRSWYIEAATSPKDILILVDNSGSMMGQRREIARHVVNNILDTLGSNDFVNVLTFIKNTTEVVPCFKNKLVQANLANIRELKIGMEKLAPAENIANFSDALITAFLLLREYRTNISVGANCNQAIMLITDGVPYNYITIFRTHNWEHLPAKPVRVFTYLIGREVADVREVKWMACANQGYYVHLSTMAEVREEVLHYIPVMARPLVLKRTEHPIIWTPVYADVTDPKMTDYLWDIKERAKQKDRSETFRRDRKLLIARDVEEHRLALKQQLLQDHYDYFSPYKMMTSVSMPVYDRRENATKVANLLGVAGTDVPNSDIQRLMVQHMLGVNAYAFIVTNNGYILIHPDLRPVFQGILKPSYNNVDVADVELPDTRDDDYITDEEVEEKCREYDPQLFNLREQLINQSNGSADLNVKFHYDGLRRVAVGVRRYYYRIIGGTPFELVVALPDPYGLNRVEAQVEIKRIYAKGKKASEFFGGHNWKIHPDWFYCKYHYGDVFDFKSPEEELMHFLNRSAGPGWKWPLQRSSSPPEHHHSGNSSKGDPMDKSAYFCDRTLFLSLVFDAKATEWFSGNISSASAEEKGKDMKQRFGLVLVFMATRSGLTRWQDISINSENETENFILHFSDVNCRAIDETWYKRAVEQYLVDPESFVYSVPFDAEDKNSTLVTATHAIFHSDGSRQAPAAVTGFQFHQAALHARFMNITSTVHPSCDNESCNKTCADSEYDCYILDNNGYIIVSENRKYTGIFFGEVKSGIMERLVKDNVYKKKIVYDYQAVCFVTTEKNEPSHSNKLNSPLVYVRWLANWVFGHILWLLVQANLQWIAATAMSYSAGELYPETYDENSEPSNPDSPTKNGERIVTKMMINRTRPQPCQMKVNLYLLQPIKSEGKPTKSEEKQKHRTSNASCDRPYVLKSIPYSNLVMVVVNSLCPIGSVENMQIFPVEVKYNETKCCRTDVATQLPRRRPKDCINTHFLEENITMCGRGSQHFPDVTVVLVLYFIICQFRTYW